MPPQGAHEIEPENKQTSSSGYAMLGSTVRRPIYLVYLVASGRLTRAFDHKTHRVPCLESTNTVDVIGMVVVVGGGKKNDGGFTLGNVIGWALTSYKQRVDGLFKIVILKVKRLVIIPCCFGHNTFMLISEVWSVKYLVVVSIAQQ
jgi:hypothetical protein